MQLGTPLRGRNKSAHSGPPHLNDPHRSCATQHLQLTLSVWPILWRRIPTRSGFPSLFGSLIARKYTHSHFPPDTSTSLGDFSCEWLTRVNWPAFLRAVLPIPPCVQLFASPRRRPL